MFTQLLLLLLLSLYLMLTLKTVKIYNKKELKEIVA